MRQARWRRDGVRSYGGGRAHHGRSSGGRNPPIVWADWTEHRDALTGATKNRDDSRAPASQLVATLVQPQPWIEVEAVCPLLPKVPSATFMFDKELVDDGRRRQCRAA